MSGINKMEIEYKFGIKNSETFDFLTALSAVKDYQIKDKSHPLFTDIFYDTPDFLLFSLGIYLRKRLEVGREDAVWTLKQADVSDEEACRRKEMIQTLPKDSTAKDISDPAFEKLLTDILGDFDLVPILTMEQDRIFKTVFKKGTTEDTSENRLGDLSVDLVSLKFSEQKHTFTELEIELANGTEKELQAFINALKMIPELQGQIESSRLSKFERGLILYFNRDKIEGKVIPDFEKKSYFTDLDGTKSGNGIGGGEDETGGTGNENEEEDAASVFEYDSTDAGFLLPREKAALLQICGKDYTADPTDYFGATGFINSGPTDLFSKQASILLALDSGVSAGFAAQLFGLPISKINEIRENFEQNRTEMFPLAFEIGENERYYYQKPITDGKVWTTTELSKYYGADAAQIDSKSKVAAILFDFAKSANLLLEKDRNLFNTAAQLSEIGKGLTMEKNVNIAADIVLTHPIENLTLNEIKTLALAFVLREIKNPAPEKIRKATITAGFYVPPAYQKKALIAAVLLEGKRFSKIEGLDFNSPDMNFPNFDFTEKCESEMISTSAQIEKTDLMAIAAEKILIARLKEVEIAEPGVLAAEDIEDVHDMRVALRKMRSSNLIFKDFLNPEWLEETENGIKKTLSGLGTLRDLDVILEKTDDWRKKENLSREKMSVFYDTVSADREKAHTEVVNYLTSDEYTDFMNDLKETLGENKYLGMPRINKKGDVAPVRICDVLPFILYEKAADITAYHEWMDGPYIYVDKLHRLRIAAKNFRYTLDFFKDCLGDAAGQLTGQLIKEFKELQDVLGDFHDAVVAVDVIGDYIERIGEENCGAGSNAEDEKIETALETLEDYKNYREQEMEELLFAFHTKWEKMDRRFFNERISKIIAEADL
ncbi:hypothetical protein MmiEs2_01730 [Methanimicrococcus stummii]|uniref:CHAD domain-containing protein n=1 Tax=Methanimicrococcus stummii TaxID=3028294 RepID=A0AA96V9Y6_9EURY|nr:CHAD domain-containing protein [Methanimicrococcus sp. Es2]WNY27993.1 hypothetical protein MmiEs2_01730 [Methanimicrococcus sp. Es2]